MDIRCGLIIILVILLLAILNMIRSGKMSMRYAFLWIILTAILLIAAIAPGFLDTLAGWLGFEVTSNMIFVVAIFLLTRKQGDEYMTHLEGSDAASVGLAVAGSAPGPVGIAATAASSAMTVDSWRDEKTRYTRLYKRH